MVLAISIGFAYLSSILNIGLNLAVGSNKWDVHFQNIQVLETSTVSPSEPTIDSDNKTQVDFDVSLNVPGDAYEFTVDVINEGTIDAMINSITSTVNGKPVSELPEYLIYQVTYKGGTQIEKYHLLKKQGAIKTYKISVKYRNDIEGSTLPESDQTFNASFSVDFIQADKKAIDYNPVLCDANLNVVPTKNIVCKRAETLHQDKCLAEEENQNCRNVGYEKDEDITYGNCGTAKTLTPGDAFTCDINADGIFNEENERFYYVSPRDALEDEDYVTLIYYNTMNTEFYTEAIKYNFDLMDWKNVTLKSSTRNYYDEKGNMVPNQVLQYGDTARLLTTKELEYATGKSTLQNEKIIDKKTAFLLEGTNFSGKLHLDKYFLDKTIFDMTWTETAFESDDGKTFGAYKWTLKADGTMDAKIENRYYSIKPVTEVSKDRIIY